MNEIQLRLLEKNLTRSAKKAQKYWIRGMVGLTEADQGFFPLEAIPVQNPIRNKQTTLAELLEDIGNLNALFKELSDSYVYLQKQLNEYKLSQIEVQNQNEKEMSALADRITALEAFKID